MLPELGGGNRNTISHTKQEEKCQYASVCVARESCFRVNPQPASLVIKVKREQANRYAYREKNRFP